MRQKAEWFLLARVVLIEAEVRLADNSAQAPWADEGDRANGHRVSAGFLKPNDILRFLDAITGDDWLDDACRAHLFYA